MQANFQHPGQRQNLHGSGDASGDGTFSNPEQNLYQKCLQPHSANHPYPGQTTTGNYLAKFSCTILQTTAEKTVNIGQSTNEMKSSQDNFNSKCTQPTGQQNSQVVLWNVPNSVQIFVPVNNISMQETINVASHNNGQNILHFASRQETFNSNSLAYMQQQTTSLPAGPNNLQQFNAKTVINHKSLNDTRRDMSPCIMPQRKQHALANILPKSQSKEGMTLPSDSKYCLPTENTPHAQDSSFGGQISHRIRTDSSSTFVNLQALSSWNLFQQNNTANKAVAVVTPLSPIEMASILNVSKKSAQVFDERSMPGTVHHRPNISHPLEANANGLTMEEPNNPPSKHQQPMSGGLTHNSAARPKSPVSTHESTNCQSNHARSPKLNSADGEQSKSASVQTQNKASENIPNKNHTVTDKKTNTGRSARYSTIPVIEWPLEKLHVLINFVQEVEDGHQKNIKNEPGKEILKLYWNGDVQKFHNVVDTGIYQNVLEEVYSYCPSKDDVILRQIKTDARFQVAEDFHVLKHNEDPPKMEYKSSWLNLNEKLDDIDKECGYSWYYRSFYGSSQEKIHEGNSECKLQRKWLDRPDEPSPTTHQCPTRTVNEVPEDGQSVLNLTQKNVASCNEQAVTGIDNHLPKVTEKQTNCQSNMLSSRHTSSPELNPMVVGQPEFSASSQNASDEITNSDLAVTEKSISEIVSKSGEEVAVQKNAGIKQMDTTASIENNASPNETSVSSATVHCLGVDSKNVNAAPKELKPSCLNTPQELITTSSDKQITFQGIEEKARAIQTPLADCSDTPSVTENGQYMTETVCDVPAEEQGYLEVKENADNESHGLLQEMIMTDTCSQKNDSVATESNTVSPLKGITKLLRTLDKRDVSLRIYEHQLGTNEILRLHQQPTRPSGMPVLNDRFCKGAGGRSPKLNNNLPVQSDITSSPRLSPIVKEHQAVMENKCHEKITSSERDRIIQTTLPNAPSRTDPDLQPNTGNPLTGMETIVSALKNRDALLKRHQQQIKKQGISKRSHEPSDKIPVLTESAIQRDSTSSAKLNSVVAEKHQLQNECNDKMLENAEIATCETVPKLRKLDNVDTSGSIQINVLPYEVAKRCFAGEMMEDEDLQEAVGMSESSRLNSSEKCDDAENNKKSHSLLKSFGDAPKLSQEEQLMGSLKDNARNSVHAARNPFQDVPLKPSQQDLLERKPLSTKESGKARLEDDFCNGIKDKIHPLTDELSTKNDFTSPSKLNPEVEGQQEFEASLEVQNECSDKVPNDDCAVTDENLIVPSPSTEVDEVVAEFEEIDAFASIKINVLPHEIAEKWFAGDTIENEDIAVNFSSKEHNDDQVEVEVLDYHDDQADSTEVLDVEILDVRSEKEVHIKNVKPKEKNNQSAADVKLESFCCFTKWFQALKHEEGSTCMCHVKTDLNEEEVKIQAHDTSLKVQKNEEDCVNVFSDNYKSMELKLINQTRDENASECAETKNLLILHTDMPEKTAEVVDTPRPDVKRRPDTPPLAVKRRPDTPPLAVQRSPDTPPLAVQRSPDTPPLAVQRRPDTPPLAVQKRPDTPPLAVQRRPDTPPLAVQRRPDTPPLAVQRRPDTPPLAVQRRPDTPPLAVQRRPDTPPLAVQRRPDTPPLAVQRRPDTPPLAVQRRPDTPPLAVQRRPDTPPLAVQRKPTTPPLAVQRKPTTPPLVVKRRSETVCLSLYGSSSKRQEIRNKRYINGCEEPPKTLEITISHHEISEGRTSKKRKWVESIENEDALDTRRKEMISHKSCDQRRMSLLHEVTPIEPSEVTKENALSSTLTRKLQNPSCKSKSGFYLAAIKKRKKKQNFGTRQVSMNNFIIRRKTVLSKSLQSPEPIIKSKYELGNPALMPLQEGSGLEFKVLPSTFNFEDGKKLGCVLDQADTSSNTKNAHSKNKKAKRVKTTNAPTPGTWCLSPLKTKHVQSEDVSGSSCTIFQEFKKKYHERKREMVPTQKT